MKPGNLFFQGAKSRQMSLLKSSGGLAFRAFDIKKET